MTKKKKPSLSKSILGLLFGIPALYRLTSMLGSLIRFEARLAGRSLVKIIVLAIMSALLLTSSWLCVLALLFLYLISLQWSIFLVMLTLLSINLIVLFIVLMMMGKYKKRLVFPETRLLLHDAYKIYEEL